MASEAYMSVKRLRARLRRYQWVRSLVDAAPQISKKKPAEEGYISSPGGHTCVWWQHYYPGEVFLLSFFPCRRHRPDQLRISPGYALYGIDHLLRSDLVFPPSMIELALM